MLSTVAICLALTTLAPAAVEVDVQTLDGRTLRGEVTAWTIDGITLNGKEGPQQFGRAELLGVRSARAADAPPPETAPQRPAAWLELVDGTRLAGSAFTLADGSGRLRRMTGDEVDVPARQLAAVRLKRQDEAQARQWRQIRNADADGDLIVIRKDKALDYLEGIVKGVTADSVSFEVEGDTIPVRLAKVEGLVFFHAAPPELPTAACEVRTSDGARIVARELKLSGGALQIVGVTGLEVTVPLEQLLSADFSAGKIRYLSDLVPRSSTCEPYLGLGDSSPDLAAFFRRRDDAAALSGPLRLEGQEYARGLALRSRSEVVYQLPSGYRQLKAVVGLDDRVRGGGGHVRLLIQGDGRELFAAGIADGESPRPLDLDIRGVRKLTILVDYGQGLDVADHLDLADARLIK